MSNRTDTVDGRSFLLGNGVAERAVAWSIVGFLVVVYLTPSIADSGLLIGFGPWGEAPAAAWFGASIVLLAAFGAAAYAHRGRGLGPAVLLVFGPVAAYAIHMLEATVTGVDYAEQIGVALLVAFAVGTSAYVLGRSIAVIGSR